MSFEIAHDAFEMVEYLENPAVHLFADTESALDRMRRTAEKADCRIVSSILIQPEVEPFRPCAPNAAALIELDGAAGAELTLPLLDWAQAQAEAGARRSVVSGPVGLIDLIAARTPHADVAHLCEAPELERLVWVARAVRPAVARLHDVGRDQGSVDLQQLSEDVGRIAAILASLHDEEQATADARPDAAAEKDEPGIDAATIRAMIRARRLRDQYFRGDLFADPAWDMPIKASVNPSDSNEFARFRAPADDHPPLSHSRPTLRFSARRDSGHSQGDGRNRHPAPTQRPTTRPS